MSSEIHIVGNLGKDAELRFMPNGDPVTSFSICSNEYSRAGETQTWYNVSLFNNSEDFGQYLTMAVKADPYGPGCPDIIINCGPFYGPHSCSGRRVGQTCEYSAQCLSCPR